VDQAPLETTVEIGAEFRVRRARRRRERAHDELATGGQERQSLTAEVAQTALDTMTDHGVAHGTADHEPDPGRNLVVVPHEVDDEGVGAGTPTGAGDASEVTATGQPMRRLEDKMERPARVRMRSRKPCTLWRRRLFGW
jgi:hypothetical protein